MFQLQFFAFEYDVQYYQCIYISLRLIRWLAVRMVFDHLPILIIL